MKGIMKGDSKASESRQPCEILSSDTTRHLCLNNQTYDESVSLRYASPDVKRHFCADHFSKINGWMNLSGISFVACINLN